MARLFNSAALITAYHEKFYDTKDWIISVSTEVKEVDPNDENNSEVSDIVTIKIKEDNGDILEISYNFTDGTIFVGKDEGDTYAPIWMNPSYFKDLAEVFENYLNAIK